MAIDKEEYYVSMNDIALSVAHETGVHVAAIKSKSRKSHIINARTIFIKRASQHYNATKIAYYLNMTRQPVYHHMYKDWI